MVLGQGNGCHCMGPLHNVINMCHYNRPYKRATLGEYSFSESILSQHDHINTWTFDTSFNSESNRFYIILSSVILVISYKIIYFQTILLLYKRRIYLKRNIIYIKEGYK